MDWLYFSATCASLEPPVNVINVSPITASHF
uniref:Uncharacterized protein n=1 Tax=Rhizophora mucronata TaxID=61149 RepID=A0A2P2PCB4_RHIMU